MNTSLPADQRSYLGDGVYVEFVRERGMLKLETRDGISATNTIWLEGTVYQALEDFVHALCEAEVEREEAEWVTNHE